VHLFFEVSLRAYQLLVQVYFELKNLLFLVGLKVYRLLVYQQAAYEVLSHNHHHSQQAQHQSFWHVYMMELWDALY
jgi:hypothetical protein